MKSVRLDMTGMVVRNFTVIDYSHTKDKKAYWNCLCVCGKPVTVRAYYLRCGKKRSCGCLNNVSYHGYRHGYRNHLLYGIWVGIFERCYKQNNPSYKHYGDRGIRVCNSWKDPKIFVEWGLANGWEKGLQIDREDNDGDYSPDNCRFVTAKVNANNKRSNRHIVVEGEKLTIAMAAEKYNVTYSALMGRLNRGIDPRQAVGIG